MVGKYGDVVSTVAENIRAYRGGAAVRAQKCAQQKQRTDIEGKGSRKYGRTQNEKEKAAREPEKKPRGVWWSENETRERDEKKSEQREEQVLEERRERELGRKRQICKSGGGGDAGERGSRERERGENVQRERRMKERQRSYKQVGGSRERTGETRHEIIKC